jgi:hypothetical protein
VATGVALPTERVTPHHMQCNAMQDQRFFLKKMQDQISQKITGIEAAQAQDKNLCMYM